MALTDKLTAIANAIRAKTGGTATMTLAEMPTEIASIQTGITPSGSIEITENGPYDVAEYAEAVVNVSGGTDYFPYATTLANLFKNTPTLPDTINIRAPLATSITSMFAQTNSADNGARHIILDIRGDVAMPCASFLENMAGVIDVTFVNGLKPSSMTTFVGYATRLEAIYGEIDMSSASFTSGRDVFRSNYLTHIRFKPNTMSKDLSFQYGALDKDSLISIANSLVEGAHKITLKSSYKTSAQAIMGTVADGIFTADESGSVTLENFITQTKGWTIA